MPPNKACFFQALLTSAATRSSFQFHYNAPTVTGITLCQEAAPVPAALCCASQEPF